MPHQRHHSMVRCTHLRMARLNLSTPSSPSLNQIPLLTSASPQQWLGFISTTCDPLSPLLATCSILSPTAVTLISPGTSGIVTFFTVCLLSMYIAYSGDL